MYQPMQPTPEPTPRSHDAVAVAIANASLLNIGYLMLGRRRLALVTGLITIGLLTLLVTVSPTPGFEILLLLWWAVLIAHGWFLAGGRARGIVVRQQRVIAIAVTAVVLLAFGLLRFDAAVIDGTVSEARQSGNCAKALTALDGVWLGDRLADAPSTASGDLTVQACQRLQLAKNRLAAGLTSDTNGLREGFDGLGSVLADLPGHDKMVAVTLDGFLTGLPTKDPCRTAVVTDWLRQRKPTHNLLDRSVDVVPRTAPDALVGCADFMMGANDFETARKRYQQLLDQYPGNALTARAQDGVTKATQAIELANVTSLLSDTTNGQPKYCSSPAQYSAAPPYGPGTNPALIYGTDEYAKQLPADWRAADPAHAVLVICAGQKDMGGPVQTCPYTADSGTFANFPTDVTWHKIAIPVKVYELRTGRLVTDRIMEIGGDSCPEHFFYDSYVQGPPPSDQYVSSSEQTVQDAFRPLITP